MKLIRDACANRYFSLNFYLLRFSILIQVHCIFKIFSFCVLGGGGEGGGLMDVKTCLGILVLHFLIHYPHICYFRGFCEGCALQLQICPMCRSEIVSLRVDNSIKEVLLTPDNSMEEIGLKVEKDDTEDIWSCTDQSLFQSVNQTVYEDDEAEAFNSTIKENLTLENVSFRSCDKLETSEFKVSPEES